MKELSLAHWDNEPTPPRGPAGGGGGARWLFSHRSRKFGVTNLAAESSAWAKSAQARAAAARAQRRSAVAAGAWTPRSRPNWPFLTLNPSN